MSVEPVHGVLYWGRESTSLIIVVISTAWIRSEGGKTFSVWRNFFSLIREEPPKRSTGGSLAPKIELLRTSRRRRNKKATFHCAWEIESGMYKFSRTELRRLLLCLLYIISFLETQSKKASSKSLLCYTLHDAHVDHLEPFPYRWPIQKFPIILGSRNKRAAADFPLTQYPTRFHPSHHFRFRWDFRHHQKWIKKKKL